MRLQIRNFRSIKNQTLELAPITVVYGSNGTGKSSLLYALLTLKRVVSDPNRSIRAFFNYDFINLGDYKAVVFDHQTRNNIELGITVQEEGLDITYQAAIGEQEGGLDLYLEGTEAPLRSKLPVTFPYPAHQQDQQEVTYHDELFAVQWNGITAQVQAEAQGQEAQETANHLMALLNRPTETLRRMGLVPLGRGFTKPNYSIVSVTDFLATEEEVATLLAKDKYLNSLVSHYLEQTLTRDFRVNFVPGTSGFSLDTTDKITGLATELVNEGFGVNQVVYILAKCLHDKVEWVCIEEPAIHLHPSAVRALATTFTHIVRDEKKRFLISTHSEAFVTALLALVAKGEVDPSELAFYWTKKDRKSTKFERQEVGSNGQVEGGLSSFMAGELEDIAAFLGIDE